jgi:uncharacterized protein (UPF0335 family)
MARSLNSLIGKGGGRDGTIDGKLAAGIIKRLMSLNDDMDAVTEDIKEVYTDARDSGLKTKMLRAKVKELRADPKKLAEEKEYMDELERAIGPFMLSTPLGQAAVRARDLARQLEGVDPPPPAA